MVEGAAERRAAGVGDEDVDGPERLGDLARQRREPVEVGGVGDERRRASPISAAASSSRSCERLAIATRAPSRASAAAIPRPIPWLAPITSADFALDPKIHARNLSVGYGARDARR